MKKAFYVDTFSLETMHEQFNSSLMINVDSLFYEVKFFMNRSVYVNSLKLINDNEFLNKKHEPIYVYQGFRGVGWICRYLISAIQNIYFFIILPKNTILIFPHNNIFSLLIINLLNKYFKKSILIFCHGEMEGLIESNLGNGLVSKFLNWNFKFFFIHKKISLSKNIYFSVFGNKIKDNLKSLIDENKHYNFISVDHPYLFDDESKFNLKNENLHFGSVGVFNKNKGANLFLELIDHMPSAILYSVNFSIIGKIVDIPFEELTNRNIKYLSQERNLITREIYDNKIEELDYILFFYDYKNYKITASGAIMDALNKEKPIIALKNDYFEYLFDTYGEFGYLFSSIEDMSIGISKLVNGELSVQFNFNKIKNNFKPESIAKQLKKELIQVNLIS